MTISTGLALKINATHGTGDVLLTVHLVHMVFLVIFEVEVTDLAVIMFCNLVRPQIFRLVEATAAGNEGARESFAVGSGRLSTPCRRERLIRSVLCNKVLIFRSDGGTAKGSWHRATPAGRCWVPRHAGGI